MTTLPLSHISVLDLTAHRAGPTAVRQLADWGAHVIKIEPPPPPQSEGGKTDAMGGHRHGFDFQNLHRNKKAMTLNLKSTEGHDIFMKLAAKADVIVENYRSDVKHRLKVDYDTVAKINPRIVYGSIAGFGQSGPDAARPGVDQIAQGMGGLMSITGEPGRGPMRVGIPIADLTSGLLLAQAMILALFNRERTGKGHARLPGLALADEGRDRQAGRQRPSHGHSDRRVPDQRRPYQYRGVRRQHVQALRHGDGRA
jgi:formyl-CoA transferase